MIVPTLGRPVLRDCLQSIVDCTRWPAQLVLVDQAADERTTGWVEDLRRAGLNVVHVRAPRRGVAAARNRGIEEVRTRFWAINDDDQRVRPDWPERMLDRLLRHPEAVVTGMVAPERNGVPSVIIASDAVIHTRPLLVRDPLFAGNMGASLEVVRRVGPFDERPVLNGAEDNEWGYRVLRAGIPIVYCPEIAVVHMDWRRGRALEETYGRYARAQGAFYGKHLRRGDAFIALRAARDILRGPWLLLRALVSHNADLAVLGRAETAGILPGIVAGFRSERRP